MHSDAILLVQLSEGINLNPLSRKALDFLFGWHMKFIKGETQVG